jgi:hypothetical protein
MSVESGRQQFKVLIAESLESYDLILVSILLVSCMECHFHVGDLAWSQVESVLSVTSGFMPYTTRLKLYQ